MRRRNRNKPPINAGVPRQGNGPRPPGRGKGAGQRQGGDGRGSGGRDYLKPPTAQSINKETRASTRTKFHPLEKKVGADLRASERRVGEEGDWWQNYLNTVSQGQTDTSAAYAQAGATQQAQIGQASQIDSANSAKLQEAADQSAALRGAASDTSGSQRETAAQAQRNYLAVAQGGALAQQGAAQRGYLNEAKRIGVGQSIASRKEEQRRGRSIRNDRQDLARERGAYAEAKRGELRGKAREEQVQRAAFGLDKKKAANEVREGSRSAAESAAERAEKRQQQARENRQKNREIRQDQEKINNEGKGGGRTPAERRNAREGQSNAKATAERLVKGHGVPTTTKEWADLEEAVAKESEVSPAEARKAIAAIKARSGGRTKNYPTRAAAEEHAAAERR